MKKLNISEFIGKKYGQLSIIGKGVSNKTHRTVFLCKCDCGNIANVQSDRLFSGNTKSCGCIKIKLDINRFKTHGLKRHHLYSVYENMKARCYNIKNNRYYRYGERGITVCEEWKGNFINFYNWAINNGWKDELQIDRIDNSSGYEPKNCRWVTQKENANNKDYNRVVFLNNERFTLTQLSELHKIPKASLFYRVNAGWNIMDALNKPIRAIRKAKIFATN